MSDWDTVLKEIRERHPFLTKLLSSKQDSSPLPGALQVGVDLADALREGRSDINRLAMVFPLLLNCPEWIAVGCSLAAISRDFASGCHEEPFSPGEKLLLDGQCVVQYEGLEVIGGSQFMWMRSSAKSKAGQKPENTRKTFRIEERLRFQPTDTRRPLTPIENLDFRPGNHHPVDDLLGIRSYGNRAIFQNRVLLVSRLTSSRQFAEQECILTAESRLPLRDLFQWGGLTVEGELEQWGDRQITAEPVLGVAPDLITLREYLSVREPSDTLVILDGRLPFQNDLQALDEILDLGYPMLALMDNLCVDNLSYLTDRSFKSWFWSGEDLQQLQSADLGTDTQKNDRGGFKTFHRVIENHSSQQIQEKVCSPSTIDEAAEQLRTFAMQRRSEDPETGVIERKFYHCLLRFARLLRPLGFKMAKHRDADLRSVIDQAKQDVQDKSIWLQSDAISAATEFIDDVEVLMNGLGNTPDKINQLEQLLGGDQSKNLNSIVLADASEVPLAESYWSNWLPSSNNVQFVTTSSLSADTECDHLIVCGWLGAKTMLDLFESCIAPLITVLLYPFEREWLRSALRKRYSRRRAAVELSSEQKAEMLLTNTDFFPETGHRIETPSSPTVATGFDIEEFELRLNSYTQAMYTNPATNGEATTDARVVAFSHEMFAYLRPNHKVPVVTDFVAGRAGPSAEVPSRDVSELVVGDYVIFRDGSDRDLLRDLADQALDKAGKGSLRQTAGLWKDALGELVSEHPDGHDGAMSELRSRGLRQSEMTIMGWLNNDHRIGPMSPRDVDVIAQASNHRELNESLKTVHRAIKEVRGAHRQAARFLGQKLIAAIPSLLQQGIDSSHTVEIEEIGSAFVVRVESIGENVVKAPATEVNYLLENKF